MDFLTHRFRGYWSNMHIFQLGFIMIYLYLNLDFTKTKYNCGFIKRKYRHVRLLSFLFVKFPEGKWRKGRLDVFSNLHRHVVKTGSFILITWNFRRYSWDEKLSEVERCWFHCIIDQDGFLCIGVGWIESSTHSKSIQIRQEAFLSVQLEIVGERWVKSRNRDYWWNKERPY